MDPGDVLDDPALVAFCTAVHPRLFAGLLAATGDRHVAEDLAQETVVRLCERWGSVREMAHPEGWVFRVALNLARSRWRRLTTAVRARRRLEAAEAMTVEQPDVVTGGWVRDAVATLPPRQRQVIALRYFADLSVTDAAAAMGCAEGTVKSLTAKATAALAAVMGDASGGAEEVTPNG